MAPYNQKLKLASQEANRCAEKGDVHSERYTTAEQDFREAQAVWKVRNYGMPHH